MLQVKPGAEQVLAVNNLGVGRAKLEGGQVKGWRDRVKDVAKAVYYQDQSLLWRDAGIKGSFVNNANVDWSVFALPMRYDYRLIAGAGLDSKFVQPSDVDGISLTPKFEYAHPSATRPLAGKPAAQGALQTMGPGKRLN